MDANSTLSELEPSSRPDPLLVLPVLLSVAWAIYELFYAPRVLAFLITKLANLFLTDSGIYIRKHAHTVCINAIVFVFRIRTSPCVNWSPDLQRLALLH